MFTFRLEQLMILARVVVAQNTIPTHLNTGSESPLADHPTPNHFYFRPINSYVHLKHRHLLDQVLAELSNFNLEHGKTQSYRKGCQGPLCRRAHRDECRAYAQRRFDRKSMRARTKPHYESVEPLLAALHRYAKQLTTSLT